MTIARPGDSEELSGQESFDDFYRRSYAAVLAHARWLCVHREEAEDAVQLAYVQLCNRWGRISGYESPEAWLRRAVGQHIMKAERTRQRRRKWELAWFQGRRMDTQPVTAAPVEDTVFVRQLLRIIPRLPRRQRQVLVLHCLEGLPQEEVAAELGISRSSVANSLAQARARLKKMLGLGNDADIDTGDALVPAPTRDVPAPAGLPGSDALTGLLQEAHRGLTAECEPSPEELERGLATVRMRAAAVGEE
ncbi:sigma-70 family RNA polymerase sigma factor [Streptomyces sp. P17]|uniref:RNA polymerase sigma factor n=1 Tax=Streptomyces sp. P17 TaxID=3074716 RepID=UPI0028F441F3|nr:sigma-70 family RNA polymerase sigma factor [Streptomyces sp. P17]MDT9701389.1 sigma-70 family RNA polymerase sigma factor [Streptomyces sp. P17]